MSSEPAPTDLIIKNPDGTEISVTDDPYSDRVRCDHPETTDAEALASELVSIAEERGRSRVVALVPAGLTEGLEGHGFEVEGVMPGFYEGQEDCAVLGLALDDSRSGLANPVEVERVDRIVASAGPGRNHAPVETLRATTSHAAAIAELLDETFADYPTPSNDPDYIARQIERGTPFRVHVSEGEIVACASADLVEMARTAELTDCATRPEHRGKGLMQSILRDLMGDVRDLQYPTVFTLARARIVGMNLAFHRLGFEHHGRMMQSCRIGDGLEDMNIWSRELEEACESLAA